MPDLLGTGSTALLAFQRTLATISHNIANANTAGYTRQRTELGTRTGQSYGFGFIGGGVQVNSVTRLQDQFLQSRLVDSSGAIGRLTPMAQLTGQLDAIVSDPATGLGAPISSYFSAIGAVAANPSSGAARQDMIAQGNALAARFRSLGAQLDAQQADVQTRLTGMVTQVNQDSAELARLNAQIVAQSHSTGGPPNDLMDQRDRVLARLGSAIGITTFTQDDGAVNAYAQGGQALVVGTTVSKLTTAPDPYDATRLTLAIDTPSGSVRVSERVAGGAIGGLLAYRREVLDPAAANLGRMAVTLALTVNAQHRQGVDATGAMGGDFFTETAPLVQGSRDNIGAATLSATITDTAALSGRDYQFRFNAGTWSAFDATTGAAVPMTGTGAPGDPFVVDGVSVTVAGAAANGDTFMVRPLVLAATGLHVAITDPQKIAAADALRGAASLGNLGTGAPGPVSITDPADPNLLVPATIQFTSATTYTIDGNGPFGYTPGTPIGWNGWRTTLSGTPQAGDSFSVTPRGAMSGDNGNARALASLATAALVGGSMSFSQANGQLVGNVGSAASAAQSSLDAETTLDTQLQAQRDSLSGVNLDEEAANLMKFQQAYQAAAQVMSIADTLFQTMINAVRG